MRIAATILCCVLVASAAAQIQIEFKPARAASEAECPFEAPRLWSEKPAEVAWAARRLPLGPASEPETGENLLRALRAMCKGSTAEHRLAVAHVLQAAMQRDVTIPTADLRFEPERSGRVLWVALQVRAATKDGRELFELFHRLDQTTDPAWEFVGGSLAIRGHGAFAIELRTHMVPKLRIRAGYRPPDTAKASQQDPWTQDGFPELAVYGWERDKFGIVGPSPGTSRYPGIDACVVDERRADVAQLRWIAQLAGEPDPGAWAARFDARYTDVDMAKFTAFAQQAERRARDSLAAADAALRRRFKLPERLVLPDLKVVYEDHRSQQTKLAQPMPAAK